MGGSTPHDAGTPAVARAVVAGARRWRARAAAHPLVADALLALLIYAVLTAGVSTPAKADGAWWLAPLCNLAPALPLVWRRRAPLAVLAASVGGMAVVLLAVGATGGEAAAIVAVATAVSREPDPRRVVAAAAGVAVFVTAVVLVAADGDAGTGIVNGLAGWVVGVAAGSAARSRRAELAAVADRGARDAALAVAQERARIARDVHDVVSHNVSVMVALSAGVEQAVDRDPAQARAAAGQAAAVGREALTELRSMLGVLDGRDAATPPDAGRQPQPGLADLPELVERARLAGLDAVLSDDGDPAPAPPVVQLTVYRVVQEALTNVLRHADATRVAVDVRHAGDAIDVCVTDDGRGEAAGTQGRGLLGMRERVALHGATLHAGPVPGGGWRVATRIPR